MIIALAPLGLTHNINIALSYQADGTVTATALVALKTKDKEFGGVKPLVFSGPVAEVEGAIAEQLPAAVGKLVTHGNNLAAIDAQLAEETKAKQAEAAKKKETAKPTPRPAAAKPAAKSKPAVKPKPAPKAPAPKRSGRKMTAAAPKPTTHTEPKATPVVPGLTPAWKSRKPEPPPPDLGTLFGEDPVTPAAEPAATTT